MKDNFKDMNHIILSTFGQSVLFTFSDHSTLKTQGIITHELVELGQYEAVSGEITVLSVESSIKLKRGDNVLANGQVYEVDRKIKDDGYLARWNIYVN